MGKTLDSVLWASADLVFRADEELNNFYDKPGKTRLGEAAKHLVPTYTIHKISQLDWLPLTMFSGAIEIAKAFGYAYLGVEAIKLISK